MKIFYCFILPAFLISSCSGGKNTGVDYRLNKTKVILRNSAATLSVDSNLDFTISFNKNGKEYLLTEKKVVTTSLCLLDSAGNKVTFTRKDASLIEINDRYGAGKLVNIIAESGDRKLLSVISLASHEKFPGVIIVRSSFRNISGKEYRSRGYMLNQVCLQPPDDGNEWWSFQGAAYKWGQDFVFKLPGSFSQKNYMGLNDIKCGSGIPLVDVWNRNFGLALASLSNKPADISLPLQSEKGMICMSIEQENREFTIMPGDSLLTIPAAIIIHDGDFFEPLKKYSELIKPLLPDFQTPFESGYEPEWCTWGYHQNFRPENILVKLDTLKALNIKSVIIDDGWSVNHGDWIPDPDKFPKGDDDFREMIDKLHENGLKVWLWWVPGYVDSLSSVALKHRDWLIMTEDGVPHPSYGLCPVYAPVQEHFKKLVQKFSEEYRLDGFKLDFQEINSAPPCYNPKHNHNDPYESYYNTPELFKNIMQTALEYNPGMLLEYCSCGIPPSIYHLPFINLAVTSDPNIGQITNRIKMYKALMGDDFPVLEEYCGVLAGPVYQLTIGTGGVPGTFSNFLDGYHEKWQKIYREYQLSKGQYLNLYDYGFDYPEGHAIKKDDRYYYSFYTHPWDQLEAKRWYRFGNEFDSHLKDKPEFRFPEESYEGKIELRGLDKDKRYRIKDYENDREIAIIRGNEPSMKVSFVNYLLLEAIPIGD